jgi:hypothetical protein
MNSTARGAVLVRGKYCHVRIKAPCADVVPCTALKLTVPAPGCAAVSVLNVYAHSDVFCAEALKLSSKKTLSTPTRRRKSGDVSGL